MLSVLRRAFAVAMVAAFSAGAVEAQLGSLKIEEIRVDVAGFSIVTDTRTQFGVGIPGSVALGIYLNDKLALEPTVGLSYSKFEAQEDGTVTISLGVFAPFYLTGDRGRNGLFVAPGLSISKQSENPVAIDFGADVGFKQALSDKVSWSAAGMLRLGDSTDPNMEIGARVGLSFFIL